MSMKRMDLTGLVFGRWTVISFYSRDRFRASLWLCRCECGTEKPVAASSLKNGDSKSCGCWNIEKLKSKRTHGHSAGGILTPEYKAWRSAKRRCIDKRDKRYPDYGERGIKMHPDWLGKNGFSNFYAHIGPKPSPEHSLDRFPNNETGHYEPGNVRWGTDEQQRRNKRNNTWIEYDGKRLIMSDWARELNMTPKLFWQRLKIWSMAEIVARFGK